MTRSFLKTVARGLVGVVLMTPVIIIGGMKFGVFTPTEAAVVAAVYGLFVGMAIHRVSRCHPYSEGGYDPVPRPHEHHP